MSTQQTQGELDIKTVTDVVLVWCLGSVQSEGHQHFGITQYPIDI